MGRRSPSRFPHRTAKNILRHAFEQFDAEVPHAAPPEFRHVVDQVLRLGVIERVATAGIRLQGMLHAHSVAQPHLVLHAGETARRRAALRLTVFFLRRESWF